MCRLFFIFNHTLTNNEIKRIMEQRLKKKSKYCLSKKDYGPRIDGMGLAYRFQDKWAIRSCPIEPTICTQVLVDLPKQSIDNTPIIVHLRQTCKESYCHESNAVPSFENTHPFLYKDSVFAHNGELDDFDIGKSRLLKHIDSEFKKQIIGKTDTEQMFYLFLTIFERYREEEKKNGKGEINGENFINFREIHIKIVEPFFRILSKEYPKYLANIIYSNSDFSIITRFSHGIKKPLSLYYSIKDGFIVTSEPIGPGAKLVPEQTAIYIHHKKNHAFLQSIE